MASASSPPPTPPPSTAARGATAPAATRSRKRCQASRKRSIGLTGWRCASCPAPALSLAPHLAPDAEGVLVLRSFGKFYGLAGLRLGFALAGERLASRIRTLAGPWRVSGPAVAVGHAALADTVWQAHARARLARDVARLDALAAAAGWGRVEGTPLFRTYHTGDAAAAQERLARARIWTRAFPYAAGWLRLGLPGTEEGWTWLARALGA